VSFVKHVLRTATLALAAGISWPLAAQAQTPFSGTPIALPGTFEAEDFDNGGEGVAYHDNVAGNAGGQYRTTESVDIIVTRDPAGGGYSVNNFETGEWMAYTVDIQAAGQYEIAIRTANGGATPTTFRVEIDGNNATGSVAVPPTGGWSVYQWVAKPGVSLPAGKHVLRLVSEQQYFDVNQIRVTATPTTPFAGVISLPGTFEAENFDVGGQDISYNDTTATNDGGAFRTTEGVDIIASRDPDDAGAGYSVNGFHAGEWMVYTVSVANSGLYDIEARVATGTFTNAAIHVEIDGVNVTGSMLPGATGNFGTYTWVKKPSVQLSAGQHVLKLVSDQEIADVNRIRVTPVTHSPFSGTPIPLPGTFEAENFDNGGEGNAYHDTDATNDGGAAFRTSEGVDIKPSPDPDGGTYVINNFQNGEWVLYTVNVAQSGNYDIDLRAATGSTTSAAFHIEIDGNVKPSVSLPATGSFGTYAWIGKQTVQLTAGQHVLKLVSDQQFVDVNQIRVVASAATGPNPQELLFRSGFESGVSISDVRDCYSNGCWQDLRGTDSASGFPWPPIIAGSTAGFQARSGDNTNPTSLSALQNYIVNEVQPGTGRTGASLHTIIKQNSCTGTAPQGDCATQDPYLIQPESEPGDMYISFWRKLDPDFLQKVVETWHVVFEWKTEGAPEDYRVIVRINTYGGTPYWDIAGDADCSPCAPFWRVNNQALPVPVGEWFKFEVFWHRAPNSNDNTGRVWVAVNGTVIADVTNGNTTAGVAVDPALPWNTSMIGVNGNHIDRIFLEQHYSGGSYPQEQWTDDVQIWKKIPVGGVDARPGDPWYDPPYGMHVP